MNDQSAYLMRAISGPVIVITIGVLFALDRFTVFRFSQTWPVLLIVIGLLKLFGGRQSWRGDDAPPPSSPSSPKPGNPGVHS